MRGESTHAAFVITSATLSAKDIEARIGLKPDDSWVIGQARGTFAIKESVHGWALESKELSTAPVEEHVKSLLRRLEPHAEKIAQLVEQAKIQLHCELVRRAAPSFAFDRDDVRWLGYMGARLDVDVVLLRDASRAAPADEKAEAE